MLWNCDHLYGDIASRATMLSVGCVVCVDEGCGNTAAFAYFVSVVSCPGAH